MSLATLTVVPTEAEAEIVCGMLHANGVACSYRKTNMAGAWTEGFARGGPTEILVDESSLDRARKLMKRKK